MCRHQLGGGGRGGAGWTLPFVREQVRLQDSECSERASTPRGPSCLSTLSLGYRPESPPDLSHSCPCFRGWDHGLIAPAGPGTVAKRYAQSVTGVPRALEPCVTPRPAAFRPRGDERGSTVCERVGLRGRNDPGRWERLVDAGGPKVTSVPRQRASSDATRKHRRRKRQARREQPPLAGTRGQPHGPDAEPALTRRRRI